MRIVRHLVVLLLGVRFIPRRELIILLVLSIKWIVDLHRVFVGTGNTAACRMSLKPALDFFELNILSVAVGTFFL